MSVEMMALHCPILQYNIAYLILYYFKEHIINICIIIIHAVLYYVEYTINLAGAATINFNYKNYQTVSS